jgi:hypothetical protein
MIAGCHVCLPSTDGAEETARRHIGTFVDNNFEHYVLPEKHFSRVTECDAYAQDADTAREGGLGGAMDGSLPVVLWGTPDRILRQLEERPADWRFGEHTGFR